MQNHVHTVCTTSQCGVQDAAYIVCLSLLILCNQNLPRFSSAAARLLQPLAGHVQGRAHCCQTPRRRPPRGVAADRVCV